MLIGSATVRERLVGEQCVRSGVFESRIGCKRGIDRK